MSRNMKQKIAELYTLTNQIRLELGQLRNKQQPRYFEPHSVSAKKHFNFNSNPPTDVHCLTKQNIRPQKVEKKKNYDTANIFHEDFNRSVQKKHFKKSYIDSVRTDMPSKLKRSNYLNIKTEGSLSPCHGATSLRGVGGSQKVDRPRSCIRLHPEKHVFNRELI